MTNTVELLESFVGLFLVFCIVTTAAYVYKLYDEEQKRSPTGRRLRKKIIAESPRVKKLDEMNATYRFHWIAPQSYHKECSSKAEFDRLSMDDAFALIIRQNIDVFRTYHQQLEENKRLYAKYQQEYTNLQNEAMASEENDAYKKMELSVLGRRKRTIPLSYDIKITKRYRSPKGQNIYSDQKVYRSDRVSDYMAHANRMNLEQERRRAQTEYERARMTNSLRYDIIKRDRGRCQICGATAEDGVKLHVDHIVPVSKGGKTEPANLRTLCDRCNLGKKDKYDPYGFN